MSCHPSCIRLFYLLDSSYLFEPTIQTSAIRVTNKMGRNLLGEETVTGSALLVKKSIPDG